MHHIIKIGARVIEEKIQALALLKSNIPKDFEEAVKAILLCKGAIITSGIGKSGYIARKIAATLSSTGTKSFFVHAAEASHGDLGMIGQNDIVVILSNSGNTHELLTIINYCKKNDIPIIGVTMNARSHLARNSKYLLLIPEVMEASSTGAPTTSTTLMISLLDAFAIAIHEEREFKRENFLEFHPGGTIGSRASSVLSAMVPITDVPFVNINSLMFHANIVMVSKSFPFIIVYDQNGDVCGIIRAKHIKNAIEENALNMPVSEIMEKDLESIEKNMELREAAAIIIKKEKDHVLVKDQNKVIGIITLKEISDLI
ncbi:MAG: SIS domain-containing protein [Rickettsiaceae bacterium]|nr:SIS domain-containing protein [Rickettsiaceae bacterium]